jgi:hypothetical protein
LTWGEWTSTLWREYLSFLGDGKLPIGSMDLAGNSGHAIIDEILLKLITVDRKEEP